MQLYDLSEEHRKIVTELSSKLANLERDSSQHHSVIEASEKQFKETLERLQQERARMEVQLQARDKEVRTPWWWSETRNGSALGEGCKIC